MSKAALSLFVFAIYIGLTGLAFMILPNFALGLLGFPETTEPWIRVIGMLFLIVAFYYTMAARSELTSFIRWTVYARSSVIVFFIIFVLLKLAEPMLLMFGVIDLLAAIWTFLALRSAVAQAT